MNHIIITLATQQWEDVTTLKRLRDPELNKYLNQHGLKQHLKSSKIEKVYCKTFMLAAEESSHDVILAFLDSADKEELPMLNATCSAGQAITKRSETALCS